MAAKSGDIPDFSAIQYYLRSSETLAPGFKAGGINADYAWQYYGGKGEGITVVSQEIGAWDDKHVDLPPRAFSAGSVDVHYHDTAAVGIMAAKDNGAGIVGIAHKATFGYAAYNASVFYELIDKLKPGDVVQVGLHIDIGSVANCQRYCFVPDEYTPHRFDEIRALTDRGIHVIEAAGNGNVNLDHPDFNHKFDRNYRDSGAIIVGALDPETGGKAWFSS